MVVIHEGTPYLINIKQGCWDCVLDSDNVEIRFITNPSVIDRIFLAVSVLFTNDVVKMQLQVRVLAKSFCL